MTNKNNYANIIVGGLIKDTKTYFGFRLKTKKVKIPKGWNQTSIACPIQYSKIVNVDGTKYEGYIRSRHESMFSMEIYTVDKEGHWLDIIWQHRPVDKDTDNPPLKSMKLIDKQLNKIKKGTFKEQIGDNKLYVAC